MTPYASWTPMTDTVEIPTRHRGDVQPTEELHILDLYPGVPTVRLTPRTRLRYAWRRFAHSPMADDLRRRAGSMCLCLLFVVIAALAFALIDHMETIAPNTAGRIR